MDHAHTERPGHPGLDAAEMTEEELVRQGPRRRIVVGVDGSFGSGVALSWAAAQALEREAVLDMVAVWEDLQGGGNLSASAREAPLVVARERLERAFQELVRERRLPARVITAPLHGPPGERLVERARDAELLVLGTTGISSPEIPGGIGLHCLRHSTTPVVFVPAPPP